MNKMIKILTTFLVLNISLFAQGFGSNGAIDARNIALGGTHANFARGVYAIGVNPANLAIVQEHSVEISTLIPLPTLNFSAGNDFITLNDYQYFFTGVEGDNGEINPRYLNNNDKRDLLDLFNQGSLINTNFGTNILSVTFYPAKHIGAFGFAIQDIVSSHINLPSQLFELFLYGNEAGKQIDLNDLDVNTWYLRNYSLTYSKDLSKLFPDAFRFISAGITFKMVQGMFYAGMDKINTTFETKDDYDILVNGDSRLLLATSPSFGIVYDFEEDDIERESSVGLFNEPAGSGFGVDFGFYADLNKAWSIAFAVTDIGSISWNEGTVEYVSQGSFLLEDITDDELVDSLKESLTGEGNYTESFSTSLSTAMKLGAGLKVHELVKEGFPGELLVEFNYSQGFNDMPSNSKKPRFSIGAEWIPVNWFKFRTGLSFGGYDKFNWASGLGFDAGLLEFDFATAYAHSLFDGNNAKRLGFAMSSRWKF